MDPKDTAPAETVSAPTTEPSAAPQATGSEVVEPANDKTPEAQPQQVEESPEELRKKLQNLEQERNLLRNKQEKFEREQEDKRKAEMSEVERLREELSEYQNKEALQEADKFRNNVLEDYLKDDAATLKAARALIEKNPMNLAWGEGLDEEGAKAEIISQLDAIKSVIGSVVPAPSEPVQSEPSASVSPNNPGQPGDVAPTREELIARGDIAAAIKFIPSVQEQVTRVAGEQ